MAFFLRFSFRAKADLEKLSTNLALEADRYRVFILMLMKKLDKTV